MAATQNKMFIPVSELYSVLMLVATVNNINFIA